jgi:hypothetical protein
MSRISCSFQRVLHPPPSPTAFGGASRESADDHVRGHVFGPGADEHACGRRLQDIAGLLAGPRRIQARLGRLRASFFW